MSHYPYAPGLNQEDKHGTYFSVLPNELLKLLNLYYYYPIKITIYSSIIDTDEYFLEVNVERYYNGKKRDVTDFSFHLKEFILFLMDAPEGKSYPEHNSHDESYSGMSIEKFKNHITIMSYSMIGNIELVYDAYETSVLIEKLQKIRSNIGIYMHLNLSSLEIKTKLQKYSY